MIRPGSDHWLHIEESPRRVRVVLAGQTIADSRHVLLLREAGCLPVYYFPKEDVRLDLMTPTDKRTVCPRKGVAAYWTIKAGDKSAESGAWGYLEPRPEAMALKDCVAFEWDQMEAWYEEDEEIFVHPRDPYKRVDVLQSSRHVRISLAGEVVAESRRPRLLFETNHPTRYYLPREDVRAELLEPSPTVTRCPYKGVASYWSVRVGGKLFKDQAWSYPEPIPECPKIKGLLCFFQEREAVIHVDGERVPAPKTRWSTTEDRDER